MGARRGIVERREGENRVVVDVPSGRLETVATVSDGRVRSVAFRNVPAFVWATGVEVGGRSVDVAYGGAFYASVSGARRAGRAAAADRARARDQARARGLAGDRAPLEPELRDIYGVIFWQEEGDNPLTQRNVTVFADGEVDRSPCGSGTSARLALLDAAWAAPARGRAASPLDRRIVVHRPGRRRGRRGRTPGGDHRGVGSGVSHRRIPVRRSTRTTRSAKDFCCAARSVPYAARVETEDDALVMYLVVRRRTTRPFAELATAAALATRRCAYRFREDDRWRDGFEDWWRHSFRKVCLRAEPREWDDLRDLDHERVGDVACLPPMRRSARDRVLVRMQTLSDEAGQLPRARPRRSRAISRWWSPPISG